jgi:putative sigma-54 modulation protein
MNIEYTGRQTIITAKQRLQAEAGLARVTTILGDRKVTGAHVILALDKYRHIAEVSIVGCSQEMVARCESVEMEPALHGALEKIEQQAVRWRQKKTTIRRHPKLPAKLMPADPPLGPPATA